MLLSVALFYGYYFLHFFPVFPTPFYDMSSGSLLGTSFVVMNFISLSLAAQKKFAILFKLFYIMDS